MIEITFPKALIFHSASHFSTLDNATMKVLMEDYEEEQILNKILTSGSKFLPGFAQSPQKVVDILQKEFPEVFANLESEDDGRARLSFVFDYDIGTSGIVREDDLTEDEKKTIESDVRDGKFIRKVRLDRIFMTRECQLILKEEEGAYQFITTFPGELAPPLPELNGQKDEFWDTHLFITN